MPSRALDKNFVLVVSPHPERCNAVADGIEQAGMYNAITFSSGQDALNHLRRYVLELFDTAKPTDPSIVAVVVDARDDSTEGDIKAFGKIATGLKLKVIGLTTSTEQEISLQPYAGHLFSGDNVMKAIEKINIALRPIGHSTKRMAQ